MSKWSFWLGKIKRKKSPVLCSLVWISRNKF